MPKADEGNVSRGLNLVRIEPDKRLVIVARTIQATGRESEAELKGAAAERARFGETCLGQALYRHRSVFQGVSDQPHWSHLELSCFRETIPADAIRDLVSERQPPGIDLLRAEILLTTPSSFILPSGWRGTADRPELLASLEYIQVHTPQLGEYRSVMRDYCGPAAAKLVESRRIGTFRAMETAAVLYRNPKFDIDWNQLHLCEVNANGFKGFGQAFTKALREASPEKSEEIARVFAGLDRIRKLPRWTFNDPVVEERQALTRAHLDCA